MADDGADDRASPEIKSRRLAPVEEPARMMWGLTAADLATILLTVGSLVLLEGLLSADNALVLAIMVRPLPPLEQRRALRYGIWGAFVFRFIAVILGSYLIRFWWLKVVGGLYLLIWIAGRHFLFGDHEELGPGSIDLRHRDSGRRSSASRSPTSSSRLIRSSPPWRPLAACRSIFQEYPGPGHRRDLRRRRPRASS